MCFHKYAFLVFSLQFFQAKKKRSNRRALDSEIHDEDQNMALDVPVARIRNLDANFVDDDELQAALARSRKAKLHKTKKLTPEELAKKSMSFLCGLSHITYRMFQLHQNVRTKKPPRLPSKRSLKMRTDKA